MRSDCTVSYFSDVLSGTSRQFQDRILDLIGCILPVSNEIVESQHYGVIFNCSPRSCCSHSLCYVALCITQTAFSTRLL